MEPSPQLWKRDSEALHLPLARMRVISSVLFPASAMSKMRLMIRDESGSGSKVGRFLGPVLHHDPVVTEGGIAGNPEAP